MSEPRPKITPMSWVSAKEVLPNEALDFTPWLANNLDLLSGVLGLDQLELVATEWRVDTFALDILARGTDADGDINVVIENQYGMTDHRHLGQILTYAAHAAAGGHRVLAVWLAEEVRPAHLAAVEFVNRVAAEGSTFGMLLMRVRFAPAPEGWHVHFEVDSEPNAFLSQPAPGPPTEGTEGAAARAAFIEEVAAGLDPLLESSGLRRRGGINTKHGAVIYRFPPKLELAKLITARVVCSAQSVNVALYCERFSDSRMNWAVTELLRRTYAPMVDNYGLRVDAWHGSGPRIKRDRVITRLPTGYADGDPATVIEQAAKVIVAWNQMFSAIPLRDVEASAAEIAATVGHIAYDDPDPGDGDSNL